jgi:hypothetical protein
MAPASYFLLFVTTTAVIVFGQEVLQPTPTLQTSFFPVPKVTGLPSVPASGPAALPPFAPVTPGSIQAGPAAAGNKPEEATGPGGVGGIGATGNRPEEAADGAHGGPGGIGGTGAAGAPGGPGGPGGAGKVAHSPFMYTPSFSIAVAAAMVFVISCTTTTVQVFHNKTWYFLLLLQAALADVVAAVARCYSILNTKSMIAFAIQMMGFKIAPSLLAISIIFTFTRIIWWVTPNEKRSRKVLLFPVHKISFFWTLFFAIPDGTKGILSQLSRPGPGKRPNPTSVFNRIQQICLTAQFFVMVLWTLWATRLMRMSRKWVISGEAEDKNWRALGWACIAASTILSVSSRPLRGTLGRKPMGTDMM